MLAGNASAGFIFGGERRWLTVAPGEFALDWSPRSRHRMRAAVQFMALHWIAADAECRRLAEEDVFQLRYHCFRRDHTQEHAGAVFFHKDGDAVNIQGAGGEQALVAIPDDLGGPVVQVGFQHINLVGFRGAGCQPALYRQVGNLPHEKTQNVWLLDEVTLARTMADAFDSHHRLIDPFAHDGG